MPRHFTVYNGGKASASRPRTYRWIDKDPDLEFIISEIIKWCEATNKGLDDISAECQRQGTYVSPHTIKNWLYGNVKRPQHYTSVAVMRAIGWKMVWQKRVADEMREGRK